MAWMASSDTMVEDRMLLNMFHTQSRTNRNARYGCEVFAVLYDDGNVMTTRGEYVPVFVFIENVNVPVFSNVDFTPDDLSVLALMGMGITAVDGELNVWQLSPKWRGGPDIVDDRGVAPP